MRTFATETALELRELARRKLQPKGLPGLFQRVLGASEKVNPATVAVRSDALKLNPEQRLFVDEIASSGRIAVLPEHVDVIDDFRLAMSSCDTPLGRHYAEYVHDSGDAIAELVSKDFGVAYSDGRLIKPRNPETPVSTDSTDPLARALAESKTLGEVRDLFDDIGSERDRHECFKLYPSIAEVAAKSLVPSVASGIAFGNLSRAKFDAMTWRLGLQSGNQLKEFDRSHPLPFFSFDGSGPDLRNGYSIALDALTMILADERSEFGRMLAKRRATYLADPATQALLPTLYGDDFAGSGKLSGSDIITFDHPDLGKTKFFTKAFQTRISITLRQLLTISNMSMSDEPGVLHIKGLGLGAFGIQQLAVDLERLFLESLQQILSTEHFANIKEIRLLNLPGHIQSVQSNPYFREGDLDHMISHGMEAAPPFTAPALNSHIRMRSMLMPSLDAVVNDKGELETSFTTVCCGDSFARFGNEGLVPYEVPDKNSDESNYFRDTFTGHEGLEHCSKQELKQERIIVLNPPATEASAKPTKA